MEICVLLAIVIPPLLFIARMKRRDPNRNFYRELNEFLTKAARR